VLDQVTFKRKRESGVRGNRSGMSSQREGDSLLQGGEGGSIKKGIPRWEMHSLRGLTEITLKGRIGREGTAPKETCIAAREKRRKSLAYRSAKEKQLKRGLKGKDYGEKRRRFRPSVKKTREGRGGSSATGRGGKWWRGGFRKAGERGGEKKKRVFFQNISQRRGKGLTVYFGGGAEKIKGREKSSHSFLRRKHSSAGGERAFLSLGEKASEKGWDGD